MNMTPDEKLYLFKTLSKRKEALENNIDKWYRIIEVNGAIDKIADNKGELVLVSRLLDKVSADVFMSRLKKEIAVIRTNDLISSETVLPNAR